jgi:hypothetical protein
MGLAEQAGVEHDVLGADDVARPVMDIDRADELLIGLHWKTSLSGGGEYSEVGVATAPPSLSTGEFRRQ